MKPYSRSGTIITFYSYKGGTGRSMALANVAWILASSGKRVLTIDWDLEAPGLHRYFYPFLLDRELTFTEGLIDWVTDYAVEALTPPTDTSSEQTDSSSSPWYESFADITLYAVSLDYPFFPDGGTLDFVPAGRQGRAYASRVNSFNWQDFYDRLGGHNFLEIAKHKMRATYDYILIDSRTGVSDTSGICTVQMPDLLTICFTLNNQNIQGAIAVAASISEQSKKPEARIFPVPMRIENAEQEKLQRQRRYAKIAFTPFLRHIPLADHEQYWGEVEVPYVPYYAYEEILAAFVDAPGDPKTLLASAERLTSYLTNDQVNQYRLPLGIEPSAMLARYQMPGGVGEYDLFLSYADVDESWVEQLAQRLEQEDWQGRRLRIFLSPAINLADSVKQQRTEIAFSQSVKIGLVLSSQAIETVWPTMEAFINTYIDVGELQRRLIPLQRHSCEFPTLLKPLLYIDFRNDLQFDDGYQRLLAFIRDDSLSRTVLDSTSNPDLVQQIDDPSNQLEDVTSQQLQEQVHSFEQDIERAQRLYALILDHSGFMHDRLASFVGRTTELTEISRRIAQQLATGGYITITGQAGQGKSSIIAKLVQDAGPEQVAYHFIPFNPGPDHQVTLLRNLMAQLILKYDLSELYVATESRPALRDYFAKILTEVASKGGQEVIYIDGLDQLEEDLTGVRDLSFLPTKPPTGIVFVLGTRPNDTLRPLELLKPQYEYQLPNLSRSDFDRILTHRGVLLDLSLTDRFYQAMHQNALYLDLIAKELAGTEAIDPETIIRHIADNPDNLFSITTDRLKRQSQRWREVIKPILGVLLVAQEPLSARSIRGIIGVDDETIHDGVQVLGGLLARDGSGRYSLYHLKLRDFLQQDETNPKKRYIFATDEEQGWHQRFASWCVGPTASLSVIWQNTANVVEQERRSYARQHYITHLYHAQDWDSLWAVLDAGSYGQAKLRFDPSTRSYIQDLDLGRRAAVRTEWGLDEGILKLDYLWRYTLISCSLASQADNYPSALFRLLVLVGREQEAIGLAELLTRMDQKVRTLSQIGITLLWDMNREWDGHQVIIRAMEVARMIEDGWERTEALKEVVTALIAAQQTDQALLLIDEALATAHSIEAARPRAEAMRAVAEALAQAQQWAQALATAHSIEAARPRAEAMRAVAEALAQAQQWAQALATAHSIEAARPRVEALSAVAAALIAAQQTDQGLLLIDEAIATAHSIQDTSTRSTALRLVVEALAQAQQWAQAEVLARSIKITRSRVEALSAVAAALIAAQQTDQALLLIDEAVVTARSIEVVWSRAEVLSTVAAALIAAQQTDQALLLIDEAVATARSIEVVWSRAEVLSTVAAALIAAQQTDQALLLIDEAIATARAIRDAGQRDAALRELAVALAHAQQWESATALARALDDLEQRALALRRVALIFAQAVHTLLALPLIDEAIATARAIRDASQRDAALRELAVALADTPYLNRSLPLIDEAIATARAIRDAGQRDAALRELAVALAHAQQWEAATVLAHSLDDLEQRALALRDLAVVFAQASHTDRALSLIDEAIAIARTIRDASQRDAALRELAVALAHAQQWEAATVLAHSLDDLEQRALALRDLAVVFAQASHTDRALSLIDEAIGTTRSISDASQRDAALRELAVALAHAQQWEAATVLAHSLDDLEQRALALRDLAVVFAQASHTDRALSLIDEAIAIARTIRDASTRDYACLEILEVLLQTKQWKKAETLACSILATSTRATALNRIAHTTGIQPHQLLTIVQQAWLEADTRTYALQLLPLATPLIRFNTELVSMLVAGIPWVDAFLKKGKPLLPM